MTLSTTEIRIYEIKDGCLEPWTALFKERIVPLRRAHGFEVVGPWSIPKRSQFIWLFTHEGDEREFEEANRIYDDSPEHMEFHDEGGTYLTRLDRFFVTPL